MDENGFFSNVDVDYGVSNEIGNGEVIWDDFDGRVSRFKSRRCELFVGKFEYDYVDDYVVGGDLSYYDV